MPLSSLISIEETAGSDALNRYDRMRSITLSFNPAPSYPLGDVMRDIEQMAKERLPSQARLSWRGEAQERAVRGDRQHLSGRAAGAISARTTACAGTQANSRCG